MGIIIYITTTYRKRISDSGLPVKSHSHISDKPDCFPTKTINQIQTQTMQNKTFRVLAHIGVNKASLGDIYSIDNELVVVTCISKKYAYLDGIPHNLKMVSTMKRNFINQWTAGKSIATHW